MANGDDYMTPVHDGYLTTTDFSKDQETDFSGTGTASSQCDTQGSNGSSSPKPQQHGLNRYV